MFSLAANEYVFEDTQLCYYYHTCHAIWFVFAEAWNKLNKVKQVWIEPHGTEELEKNIQEYYAAIKEQQGGMFIAVCRGKVRHSV